MRSPMVLRRLRSLNCMTIGPTMPTAAHTSAWSKLVLPGLCLSEPGIHWILDLGSHGSRADSSKDSSMVRLGPQPLGRARKFHSEPMVLTTHVPDMFDASTPETALRTSNETRANPRVGGHAT